MALLTNDHPLVQCVRAKAVQFFAERRGAREFVLRPNEAIEARAIPSADSPQGIRVLIWIPPRARFDLRAADWDSDRDESIRRS